MARQRTGRSAVWLVAGLACVTGLTPGCAMLNGFLDPTKMGAFPIEPMERGIRRTLTLRETPPGVPEATEPTPGDLVSYTDDYRIGPNDVIATVISDLLGLGVPFQGVQEVTATGYIRIPELGVVKVDGLTELELEDELKARLAEAELSPDPIIQAVVQTKRSRLYYIIGSALAPGPYPLTQSDFRMLDAIGLARGLAPGIRTLYVIRRGATPAGQPVWEPAQPPSGAEGLVIPPPMDEDETEPGGFVSAFGAAFGQDAPQTQESAEKKELESIIAPSRQTSRPTDSAPLPWQSTRPFEPLVLDPETGEAVEVRPGRAPPEPQVRERQRPEAGEPFDWEDISETEFEQRIIAIDVKALQNGDPTQNIVIRDQDWIYVPVDNRAYYLMGEVLRPGVYGFGGREITIKKALAAAGGFGPLAWPSRCEIIREDPSGDRQITIPVNLDAVFAGLQDDFYLRDNDIVNVGTHFVAPFLFVIRNSFRFTYGFGFVYDRNFADQDAIGGKLNPEIRRDQERARRGLPF